jgi:hypothetical protein
MNGDPTGFNYPFGRLADDLSKNGESLRPLVALCAYNHVLRRKCPAHLFVLRYLAHLCVTPSAV